MAIVKETKRKGRPKKGPELEDESSLGSVGYYIGALPKTEDAGKEKKVARPKVPKSAIRKPSKAANEAPAERVGYYIGALTPMDDEQEAVSPPPAKRPRAQTRKAAPAQKVGRYTGADAPSDDVKEKRAASKRKRTIVRPTEERVGYYIGALPAAVETPVKQGPVVNAKAPDCGFGWVEMQGKRYDFDVIVHVDGSVTKREKCASKQQKKKYGHTPLTRKELKALRKEAPAMIIIGTGHSGAMPLTPKAEKFLEDYLYFVGKTPMALEKLATCEKKVVALLHVTC
jgi:hypothetical protein